MHFSSNKLSKLAFLGFVSLVAVACSAANGEYGETIDTAEEEVIFNPPNNVGVGLPQNGFQWFNGNGDVSMTPAATSTCFLTSVGGRFSQLNDRIEIVNVGGIWKLRGSAPSGLLQGRAFCVTGVVPLVLPSGAFEETWQNDPSPKNLGSVFDRSCFLTAVFGDLAANGEEIRTRELGTGWVLDGHSAAGKARCIPKLEFSPISVSFGGGSEIPGTDQGFTNGPTMCALTRASGRFRGGSVKVFSFHQSANVWDWRINATTNPISDIQVLHQPAGSAACFL